jgi:hypothetical protein
MDNLSGTPNYSGIILNKKIDRDETAEPKKGKKEIDSDLKNKIIEEYKNLIADCEKLYKETNNKNLGDLWISLYTLKKQIGILSQ